MKKIKRIPLKLSVINTLWSDFLEMMTQSLLNEFWKRTLGI